MKSDFLTTSYLLNLHGNMVLYYHQGQLHDDTIVAVKRLKHYRLTNKGREHFSREVEMMSKLMHANLAKLLCYCQEADEWILVYEWMERQSLNLYIFGTSSNA